MDIITLLVVGGVTYYLITSGTLDQIIQNLNLGGGATGGATTGAAYGGSGRGYKAPSGSRSSGSGYTTGGGSYGGGSPGWYTSGPNGSGHHHCVAHTAGCLCTDPGKCVSQGVPPTAKGECAPEWGTKQALGGGPYPDQSQLPQEIAKCPAGTH